MKKEIRPMRFNDGEFVVAIIHYNTPELTRACIGSLIYNGGVEDRLRIVVFDNSDSKPFGDASGMTVIDNTQGQVIDFDAELAKFPDRDRSIGCAKGCEFGSVKHMMTVQKLWELIPTGFVLMESDILITKSIAWFWRPEYSFVGYAQRAQPHNPFNIGRVLPMLCYMNVPLLTKHGARYYDPTRTYGLLPGGRDNRNNWYDTGSVMLEDILSKRPHLKGLHEDIRPYVVHYGSASWQKKDEKAHQEWIKANRHIFPTEERIKEITDRYYKHIEETREPCKVAVCAIGRLENRYAREWVEHYKALGVDHIFICDDNRPEDGERIGDVLLEYVLDCGDGSVTIMGSKPGGSLQKDVYKEFYNVYASHYAWVGFFDFDELVRIENGRDIHDFLNDYEADVVSLNWRTMTDSGLVHYDERPMAERFTQGTGEDFQINRHVKSFVRTGIKGISFNDPHIPNAPTLQCENVLHERIEQKPVQDKVIHRVAWIDHYNTKTAEEWATLKMRRLSPCGDEYNREMKAKNVDYFFSINERTPEKEEILGVKPKKAGKAASKREQSQTGLNSAEREQANQGERLGKPKTTKRTNSKKE